jgi:poly(hydroxyalkanoate) granule-associated protein
MAARKARSSPAARHGKLRDAFESAQNSMQERVEGVRDQAGETWDNLEALFQSRVQRALRQIGVPSAEEIRLLTKRVTELSVTVNKLAGKQAPPAGRPSRRKS